MSAKKSSPEAPARGEVIWLEMSPSAGHEQAGRRPALVVSHTAFNERRGLALVCPVTSHPPRYDLEIPIPEGLEVSGTILADQVRMVDFRARHWRRKCSLPDPLVLQVSETIKVLF